MVLTWIGSGLSKGGLWWLGPGGEGWPPMPVPVLCWGMSEDRCIRLLLLRTKLKAGAVLSSSGIIPSKCSSSSSSSSDSSTW